eukprot:9477549-Pyramimonas_sp.AAC.1
MPEALGSLRKLVYLDLQTNFLYFLPVALNRLTNLQELYLACNLLENQTAWEDVCELEQASAAFSRQQRNPRVATSRGCGPVTLALHHPFLTMIQPCRCLLSPSSRILGVRYRVQPTSTHKLGCSPELKPSSITVQASDVRLRSSW